MSGHDLGILKVHLVKHTNTIHIWKESSLILAIYCDDLLKFLKKETNFINQYPDKLFWTEDDHIVYSNTNYIIGSSVHETKKEIDELI